MYDCTSLIAFSILNLNSDLNLTNTIYWRFGADGQQDVPLTGQLLITVQT